MQTEYVVEKLVSALSRLSDQELRDLSELFRYGNAAEVFGGIIERMLYLRGVERQRRRESRRGEVQRSRESGDVGRIAMGEPAKERFFALLNNRDLFPSTRDVVDVLNGVFNLGFRYEDYQKEGRRDLIQKCWRHLERMAPDERRKILKRLSQRHGRALSGSEGYHELFRILSQR